MTDLSTYNMSVHYTTDSTGHYHTVFGGNSNIQSLDYSDVMNGTVNVLVSNGYNTESIIYMLDELEG